MSGCSAGPSEKPAEHPTFVSLNPCTDAILAEVATSQQVLALSHYSHDPAASSMEARVAGRFRSTGGTVEEVLALKPDIVLAGSFLSPPARQAFEDFGIRVETFGVATTVADSVAQVGRMAELTGHPGRGERLAARIESAVVSARPGKEDAPPGAVLWQPGGIVPGDGALVSEMMRIAGLGSHSAAMGMGQADYLSLEAMLTNPPDVLLVAGRERSQSHPTLDRLDKTRVEPFDTSLLYCGGPTIIRALDRLTEIRMQTPLPQAAEAGGEHGRSHPVATGIAKGSADLVASPASGEGDQ